MQSLKVAGLTAIAHFSKLLVALLIIKLIAVASGPEGLAFLGNYMSLISIASSLAGGGIITGVIKYLAEHKTKTSKQYPFIGNALVYSITFSIIVLLLGITFLDQVTFSVFGDLKYTFYIYFLLFAQFFIAINNWAYGILNGLGKNASYALVMVLGNLIAMVLAYLLILNFGITGSVIAVALPLMTPIFPLIFFYYKKLSELKFDLSLLKTDTVKLSRFGFMLVVSAVCFPIVEIFIRNSIISSSGLDVAGIWQALIRLSSAYLSFFSVFLSFYLVPKISSTNCTKAIANAVLMMMMMLSLIFASMCGITLLIKDHIVLLILSESFLAVGDYLMLQMLGDYFRIMGWVIGFVVVAKAATKLYICSELFQGLSFMFFASVLTNYISGLNGVIYGYVLTSFLYFIFSVVGFLFFLKFNKHIKVASCKQQ